MLTGTIEGGRGGPVEIKNGKVDGDKISFEVTREMQGNSVTIKYTGHVTATSLTLSFDTGRGAREMTLTKQVNSGSKIHAGPREGSHFIYEKSSIGRRKSALPHWLLDKAEL